TLLFKLGVTDAPGKLTSMGNKLAGRGTSVCSAAMLYHARQTQNKCVIQLAALLTAIIEEPPRGGVIDLHTYLERPTENWCKRASILSCEKVTHSLGKTSGLISEWLPTLLAAGFPGYIAKSRDN